METGFYDTGNTLYAAKCDVVHLDHSNTSSLNKLTASCIISSYFSVFETELRPVAGLGIKYVSEGKETYWVKGRKYEISGGKYLLVNESEPVLDATIKGIGTWGMCANIEPVLLNDLLYQVLFPNDLDGINQVQQYLLSPELLVREAKASENLQLFMAGLIRIAATQQKECPPIELIYELTSLLIKENLEMIRSYYKLETVKRSTRRELFQRLLRGKEMLDDSVFTEINIAQVADMCCLSEFRFYRLFRQCFGVSPYNYLFKRRIEKSLELRKQNLNWSEIAYQLNFTDLAAFSKGFKKVTGVTPSSYTF